jgi:hypothetical protein
MDAAWCSLIGVNPRDLELDHNIYHDPDIPTSVHASHADLTNETQSGVDSWLSVPGSTRTFLSTAFAGPNAGMGAIDVDMSGFGEDFQINGAVGLPGKHIERIDRIDEY